MALSATTIWEVETGASDTLNGGAFDPGQTAGMFTDGAATVATGTAPVFTSASYNFVAGDAGAWVYVASGTNWTAGWYKIASVAANAATLNATIGQAVLKAMTPTTVAGCATTASPTGATWTIDYSQQTAAQFAYTDLVSVGTGLTVSSAAKPFAKQQVGNSIVITGGTNFNLGRYVIASVAASVATVVGPTNITTGAGATGTGGQGGAFTSLGAVGAVLLTSQAIFIKTGTYSITSASTNIAGGCFSESVNAIVLQGYGSVRGDYGTPPILQASGISTAVLVATTGTAGTTISNLTVDGATLTSIRGLSAGNETLVYKVTAKNCTNTGLQANSSAALVLCVATGCSTQVAIFAANLFGCEAFANSISGISVVQGGVAERCLSYNNTGASSHGFSITTTSSQIRCCSSYGNGGDGFRWTQAGMVLIDCLAEANTGIGFNSTGVASHLSNCGAFNNTGGATSLTATYRDTNFAFITATASFFVNPGSGNLALNSTAGGGAVARAAGIPGVFFAGTTTGFLDVGAAQHADPASAGMLFIPNLEGT